MPSSGGETSPMERVLYNLHYRCCSYALQTTSRRSRSYAEHTILVLAVCCFGALLLAHRAFVVDPSPATIPHQHYIPTQCLSGIEGFDANADVTHLVLISEDGERDDAAESSIQSHVVVPSNTNRASNSPSCLAELNGEVDTKILFSYARQQGFLYLSPNQYPLHNVRVQYVHVSHSDSRCFGEPFVQRLVFSALGSDTVLINWLLGTFHYHVNATKPGYIWNARTHVMIHVNDYEPYQSSYREPRQWWQQLLAKGVVIIKTAFLFFVTTTLVAFTLRETQGRMLHFTQSLQYHVRNHQPVIHLVTTHVIENVIFVPIMVGMIFFLIQCYRGDKFLAFMVLSLVWVCESFSVVSLRTEQGIKYFPLFFFQLFAMFHYYHMMFPLGFSYAALTTSMMFMMHSMLFFWHRYELPAVILGRVGPEHVRENSVPAAAPPPLSFSTSPGSAPPSVQSDSGRETPEEEGLPPTQPTVASVSLYAPQERIPVGRTHSFNTLASGRISRNSSNVGMYHRGDDDDGSFMFFMGGEVVIPRRENHQNHVSGVDPPHHRHRPTSPYSTATEYNVPLPTNPVSRTASVSSSFGGASVDTAPDTAALRRGSLELGGRRERFVNELSPVLAGAMSMDDDSEVLGSLTPVFAARLELQPAEYGGHPHHQIGSDEQVFEGNDPSALQAIINVMHEDEEDLTTSSHPDEEDDVAAAVTTDSIFR